MTNTRSVPVWREPVRGGFPDPGLFSLSGIELIGVFARGDVAPLPMTRLLGIKLTQHGPGAATFVLPAVPWLQLPDGSLDVCVPAGMALRTAVLTTAPPATEVTMAAFSVNRLRPFVLASERAVARARVVTSGRAYTFAEVQVEDGLGRHLAHATGSFVLRRIVPPPPAAPERFAAPSDERPSTPDPPLRSLPAGVFPFGAYGTEPGLDGMRRLANGSSGVVPGYELVGLRVVAAEPRLCVTRMPATEWTCSIHRTVEPSVLAMLASQSLTAAVQTLLPAGKRVGVLDQSTSFVRGVVPDGRDIDARATVANDDEHVVVSKVDVTDADGNLVALGYQTSAILEGAHRARTSEPERVLATVLFVDIVDSTKHAQTLGDAGWRDVLDSFERLARSEIDTHRGRAVKGMGDGFLAVFDAAARAVRCAAAVREGASRIGLQLRAGLHVGECELVGSDVSGIAVHVASRVQASAAPGEILVSDTLRDAVAGSGLVFTDRGRHVLRGVEGERQLYALDQ